MKPFVPPYPYPDGVPSDEVLQKEAFLPFLLAAGLGGMGVGGLSRMFGSYAGGGDAGDIANEVNPMERGWDMAGDFGRGLQGAAYASGLPAAGGAGTLMGALPAAGDTAGRLVGMSQGKSFTEAQDEADVGGAIGGVAGGLRSVVSRGAPGATGAGTGAAAPAAQGSTLGRAANWVGDKVLGPQANAGLKGVASGVGKAVSSAGGAVGGALSKIPGAPEVGKGLKDIAVGTAKRVGVPAAVGGAVMGTKLPEGIGRTVDQTRNAVGLPNQASAKSSVPQPPDWTADAERTYRDILHRRQARSSASTY